MRDSERMLDTGRNVGADRQMKGYKVQCEQAKSREEKEEVSARFQVLDCMVKSSCQKDKREWLD